VQVVARSGELGDLPRKIAALATNILRKETFPSLIDAYPWIKDQLTWPVLSQAES
jgi:hypothetical protein